MAYTSSVLHEVDIAKRNYHTQSHDLSPAILQTTPPPRCGKMAY